MKTLLAALACAALVGGCAVNPYYAGYGYYYGAPYAYGYDYAPYYYAPGYYYGPSVGFSYYSGGYHRHHGDHHWHHADSGHPWHVDGSPDMHEPVTQHALRPRAATGRTHAAPGAMAHARVSPEARRAS